MCVERGGTGVHVCGVGRDRCACMERRSHNYVLVRSLKIRAEEIHSVLAAVLLHACGLLSGSCEGIHKDLGCVLAVLCFECAAAGRTDHLTKPTTF